MSLKKQLVLIHVFFAALGVAVLIAVGFRLVGRKVVARDDKSGILIPDADVVQALTDPTTRVATARECGRRKDRSAVPILRGFAKDRDPEVRLACVWALGEIGDPEAVYALRVRMGDMDIRVRKEAAIALGKMGGSGEGNAVYSLIDGLKDQAVEVQIASVEGLGMLKTQAASEALRGALASNKAADVRQAAVRVLNQRDDIDATRILCHALNDRDAAIRLTAIKALNKRRTEPTYDAIARALRDPDQHVRAVAIEAIAGIGQPILPHVKSVLPQTRHMEARLATVQLLERIETDESIEAMIEMLEGLGRNRNQDRRQLRDSIVEALTPRGAAALPMLTKCVINGEGSRLAEEAAAELCRRIGKPAVKPVSDGILRWKLYHDPEELKLWVKVLGDIGDPGAVEALNRALSQDIEGMDALVAEARAKIERKSNCELPPAKPHGVAFHQNVPDVASLDISPKRPPSTKPVAYIPDDGVLHLCLQNALIWPGNGARVYLDIELIRRGGRWEKECWGRSNNYNRQQYFGDILEESTTREGATLKIGMAVRGDGYVRGGYGEYTVTLCKDDKDEMSGHFKGRYDLREVAGSAFADCREGKIATASEMKVGPDEHPRLIFNKSDLPRLRARALTELGRNIVRALQRKIVAAKAYDYRKRWNAVGYGGEVDRAVAQGFLAHLFDDPVHGRRAAENWLNHVPHDPYAGEHGGPELWPLACMGFAFDMVHDFATEEERLLARPRQLEFGYVINARHGMLGSYGDHTSGYPVPLALALLGKKGKLDAYPPREERAVIALPPLDDPTLRKGTPVAILDPKAMIADWLAAGPFDLEKNDDEPLAALGGPAALRPHEGTEVKFGKVRFRFMKLPADCVRETPSFGTRGQCIRIPAAGPDSVTYLYCVVDNREERGVMASCQHPVNPRPATVWLNGRELESGTVAMLEPGLYTMMVRVVGPVTSPGLTGVDAGYWYGRRMVYERWLREYERAVERHRETGEIQSPRLILGYCLRGYRNLMRYQAYSARRGSGWLGVSGGRRFALTPYQNVLGEPLQRDTPLPPDAWPTLTWRSLQTESIPEYVHLASSGTRPALLWEFNKAYVPDNLGKLSAVSLVHAFVNLPMELKPRKPDTVLARHTKDDEYGYYSFCGPDGNYMLGVNTRARLPRRTVRRLPKAGSFQVTGDGMNWITEHGVDRTTEWDPVTESGKHGVEWITTEHDDDRSKTFEAVVRVGGSRLLGCGKLKYCDPEPDGSGTIGIDLTDAYSKDADEPIKAERHIAIDYSGKSGATVLLAVVDKIRGGGKKTYMLPPRLQFAEAGGKHYDIIDTGNTKCGETLREADGWECGGRGEGNRVLYWGNHRVNTWRMKKKKPQTISMQVCYVSPDKLRMVPWWLRFGRHMNMMSPMILAVSEEKNVDFFVVITMQQDDTKAPKIECRGKGLDAVVTVGNRKVRFNGQRILIGD